MTSPVLAMLNLKGGVGKTTIAANLAFSFFDMSMSTLVIDLDPQYNLTQSLVSRDAYDLLRKKRRTIFAAFEPPAKTDYYVIRTSDEAPPSPKTLAYGLWYETEKPTIVYTLIPGAFDLVKYSLSSDQDLLNAVKLRFRKFIAQAQAEFDLVVLDCNPSSSFLTQCALEVASDVLVPVRPDRYSVLGVELLAGFVRNYAVHPRPRLHVLLNGVTRSGPISAEETDLRSHSTFRKVTLVNKVYLSKLLHANHDFVGLVYQKKFAYRDTVLKELAAVAKELLPKLRGKTL
jgi:chromosome partitioning protein